MWTTSRPDRGTGRVEEFRAGEGPRLVARVGLAGFEHYYPHQLYPRQHAQAGRVAQTLANEPSILLMDEPFSALDVQTRALMQRRIAAAVSGTGAAVIFVTHDLEEAVASAFRCIGPATSSRSG
ncbi:hypothetical protein ACWDKQ_28295 [Saccharopolyspora sp. NPDC000995]